MNTKIKTLLFTILFSFVYLKISFAQTPNLLNPPINESILFESVWQYSYLLHVESNTVVHQALDNDKQIIYFKYNNTAQVYLNNEISSTTWNLLSNQLLFTFKDNAQYTIVKLNNKTLILEYRNPKAKGTYQYHFKHIENNESPFERNPNELPLVTIEENEIQKGKWWKKDAKITDKKINPTFINIELSGGGYYGGINPALRDYIQIKNDGRLIKEFKGASSGLIKTRKNISRLELEQLASFMVEKKFFELAPVYDCKSGLCSKRKTTKPTPIPLRISFTYGNRHKVITVQIWGKDELGVKYVDYPNSLDDIIETIQSIAHRIEPKSKKDASKRKVIFW